MDPPRRPVDAPLGYPTESQGGQDGYKSLISKLAWAVGTTYGVPYTNVRLKAHRLAVSAALSIVRAEGYPPRDPKNPPSSPGRGVPVHPAH